MGAANPQESGRKTQLFFNASFVNVYSAFLWLVAAQLLVDVTFVLQKKGIVQCNFCSAKCPKIAVQLLFSFVACFRGEGGGWTCAELNIADATLPCFPFSTFFFLK